MYFPWHCFFGRSSPSGGQSCRPRPYAAPPRGGPPRVTFSPTRSHAGSGGWCRFRISRAFSFVSLAFLGIRFCGRAANSISFRTGDSNPRHEPLRETWVRDTKVARFPIVERIPAYLSVGVRKSWLFLLICIRARLQPCRSNRNGDGFSRYEFPSQGLKPNSYSHVPARLKPCPDTKPPRASSHFCVAHPENIDVPFWALTADTIVDRPEESRRRSQTAGKIAGAL